MHQELAILAELLDVEKEKLVLDGKNLDELKGLKDKLSE